VGALDPAPGTPLRAVNALVPFGIVLAASFGGMVFQGLAAIAAMPAAVRPAVSIVNSLRYADSVSALIWGSTFGWLAAMVLVLSQRLLKLEEAMGAWIVGAKEVLEPMIILVLAWSLGSVIKDVGTAEFLASALQTGLPAWALPACIAALCYAISFASGSAIGTMGIVFPLVGPLAMRLGGGSLSFLHQCFGAIMGASIFGNLCSPLGDTSILTALATRCSLQLHISTVIGYTCLVALIALIFGDLAVGLGLYGPLAALGVCTALMTAIKLLVGRPVEGGKEQPA
jgi:Na+/H+ antiporter NhaC